MPMEHNRDKIVALADVLLEAIEQHYLTTDDESRIDVDTSLIALAQTAGFFLGTVHASLPQEELDLRKRVFTEEFQKAADAVARDAERRGLGPNVTAATEH